MKPPLSAAFLKSLKDTVNRALALQVTAAERVRDCPRCHGLFEAAVGEFFVASHEGRLLDKSLAGGAFDKWIKPRLKPQTAWGVTNDLLRELRECERWPEGI